MLVLFDFVNAYVKSLTDVENSVDHVPVIQKPAIYKEVDK